MKAPRQAGNGTPREGWPLRHRDKPPTQPVRGSRFFSHPWTSISLPAFTKHQATSRVLGPLILQSLADLSKLQRLSSSCRLSINNPAAAPEVRHARRGEFKRLSAAESLGPIPLLYKTILTQGRKNSTLQWYRAVNR